MNEILKRKKGFNILDGEEMFHMLYNKYYEEWKSKRQDYVKYATLHKLQKKKKTHRFPSFNSPVITVTKDPNQNDFS